MKPEKLEKKAEKRANDEVQAQPAAAPQASSVQGRSVFALEMTGTGLMVRTAFLVEDGRVLQMPAVFPTLDYAYAQIDELRRQVSQHFAKAALIGGQALVAQVREAAQASASASDAEVSAEVEAETEAVMA